MIVLVVLLSIVGCSEKTNIDEDKLKAEIRAELEAEAANSKQQDLETQANEQKKGRVVLEGTIVSYGSPFTIGMVLDAPITVDGREVKEIYFNEDVITNLVPRKYFTFYLEGRTSIAEQYNGKIPIKVEIDEGSCRYYEDRHLTYADIVNVISIDGEKNPGDKTNDEYPLDYYKSVFYAYCYQNNEIIPRDVKKTYYYINTDDERLGDLYKRAVDKILEAGLFINMGEGIYYIEDQHMNYTGCGR